MRLRPRLAPCRPALDRSGFTVEDRDRAGGLYFVRYVDPKYAGREEPNFFSKLFSSDKNAGAPQRYRIAVKRTGDKTMVAVQSSARGAGERRDRPAHRGTAGRRVEVKQERRPRARAAAASNLINEHAARGRLVAFMQARLLLHRGGGSLGSLGSRVGGGGRRRVGRSIGGAIAAASGAGAVAGHATEAASAWWPVRQCCRGSGRRGGFSLAAGGQRDSGHQGCQQTATCSSFVLDRMG